MNKPEHAKTNHMIVKTQGQPGLQWEGLKIANH